MRKPSSSIFELQKLIFWSYNLMRKPSSSIFELQKSIFHHSIIKAVFMLLPCLIRQSWESDWLDSSELCQTFVPAIIQPCAHRDKFHNLKARDINFLIDFAILCHLDDVRVTHCTMMWVELTSHEKRPEFHHSLSKSQFLTTILITFNVQQHCHIYVLPSPQHSGYLAVHVSQQNEKNVTEGLLRVFYSSQSFISLPLQTFVAPRTALKQFFFFLRCRELFLQKNKTIWDFSLSKHPPNVTVVNNKRSVLYLLIFSDYFPSNFSAIQCHWRRRR